MRLSPRSLVALVFLGAGLSGGCGGSTGPTSSTIGIGATANVDGWVSSSGTVDTNDAFGLVCGDGATNLAFSGFLRFSLASIPAGSLVTAATLSVQQWGVTGVPYSALGNLIVDHVNLGAGLDATDFGAAAIMSNFGTLSTTPVLGIKTLDVTARVQADLLAARTNSDFRLRFGVATDNDGGSDFAALNDSEDQLLTGQVPVLTVIYSQ